MQYCESINVPVELVPYVKSLIQTHLMIIEMNQRVPPPPPPPQYQAPLLPSPILSSPLLPSPPITRAHEVIKYQHIIPTDKKIDDDRNHFICTDWLNNNCSKPSCPYKHMMFDEFKTSLCSFWKSGSCRYEDVKCRGAHGESDPYNRLPTSRVYIDNVPMKRSRFEN
jgi:hypothetical protein